ncbi:unnamed protein product, partial [Ectocarpus sp. 12 AP-2014]
RHPIIVGPKGATLKRISAANAVRITVPSEKEAAQQQQQQHGWPSSSSSSSSLRDKNLVVQLEGEVEAVFSSLAMIMEAVYRCPAATLVGALRPPSNSLAPPAAATDAADEPRRSAVPPGVPAALASSESPTRGGAADHTSREGMRHTKVTEAQQRGVPQAVGWNHAPAAAAAATTTTTTKTATTVADKRQQPAKQQPGQGHARPPATEMGTPSPAQQGADARGKRQQQQQQQQQTTTKAAAALGG